MIKTDTLSYFLSLLTKIGDYGIKSEEEKREKKTKKKKKQDKKYWKIGSCPSFQTQNLNLDSC